MPEFPAFSEETITTIIRLLAAIVAGGIIGLERSYNGRPAGFRTHSLVCMASSLLMLLTAFQWDLLKNVPVETLRIDPTRMAQGIMTGIGFLGAGVIMKEHYSIRGLTTAASIWMTASIGILIGVGFYVAAGAATILSLGVLSLFRWFEQVLPTLDFAHLKVRTLRKSNLTEDDLIEIIAYNEIKPSRISYALENEGKLVCYDMIVKSRKQANFRKLAETFNQVEEIQEYTIDPRSG